MNIQSRYHRFLEFLCSFPSGLKAIDEQKPMIAPKKILVKTRYYLVSLISLNGDFYQNIVLLAVTFSNSVSTLFLALVGFIKKLVSFFSVEGNKTFQMCDSSELTSSRQENFPSETEEAEEKESDMIQLKNSDTHEEETSEFVFKFEYQTETFERFLKGVYEGEDSNRLSDSIPSSPIGNNYETKPSSCVNDDLEDASLLCSDSDSDSAENEGFLMEEDFLQEKSADVKPDASIWFPREENFTMKPGQKIPAETQNDEIQFLSEDDFIGTISSDSATIDSSPEFGSQFIASTSDGFFSDSDFEEELSEPGEHSVSASADSENCEQKEADLDQEDDCNGLESLWEHQDLIEQLKMEVRKVKATGLPTIFEDESESPQVMEGLKPWKIEEEKKFQFVDRIWELHKFYKSYRERMRKLDILNYQKMYALGLLQSKDQFQAMSTVKTFSPPPTLLGSVIGSNFWLCKPRKSKTDPVVKFMKELQSELEQVYVGQLCLSWEILHWQYEKAIELWESDTYGFRSYNEVAGEFQQFQVLLQRFLENEEFEGPRVESYVKKRCVLRNLLQVPVIREDRDKKRPRADCADDAVTSDKLLEMIEESIRLFWRFVRADKHVNSSFQKTGTKSQIQPEDPEGLEMFAEIKTALQQKEKKLKDVLRCGNCILRKFQKNHQEEDDSEQVLRFFSQVDMKLVTRVLNMSELTRDHLIWCHSKLSKISFVNRRIHVEPSFCLFPC